jgi:hypothetical protein
MLKNQQEISNKSSISSNNINDLVLNLCSKIASTNNLNDQIKEDFVKNNYSYIVKLFGSDSYCPVYDAFEVSQKIKKKRCYFFQIKKNLNSHSFLIIILK